jgi:hypothetical protein
MSAANARRGGVISPLGHCRMGKDRHPTPPHVYTRVDPPPPGEGKSAHTRFIETETFGPFLMV